MNNSQNQQKFDVPIAIQIDSYDDLDSTRIPVNISGKDSNNKSVEELQFIDGSGNGISLPMGEYKLTFKASPLCNNGNLYEYPADIINIKIDSNNTKNSKYESSDKSKITFNLIETSKITDEQIHNAYEYALKGNEHDIAFANVYMENTKAKRDEALKEAEKQTSNMQSTTTQNTSQPQMLSKTDMVHRYSIEMDEAPFWGVWFLASKSESEAKNAAIEMQHKGFPAHAILTTNWSNLNPEPWWCVSAGACISEQRANELLELCKDAGYTDGYVKYSGDYQGK